MKIERQNTKIEAQIKQQTTHSASLLNQRFSGNVNDIQDNMKVSFFFTVCLLYMIVRIIETSINSDKFTSKNF